MSRRYRLVWILDKANGPEGTVHGLITDYGIRLLRLRYSQRSRTSRPVVWGWRQITMADSHRYPDLKM